MKDIVLTESSNKRNTRKYKCPYCDTRLPKERLITHIEGQHEDMIPEGYTAARIVFNMINHKETGHCVQCRKETEWDENTQEDKLDVTIVGDIKDSVVKNVPKNIQKK